MIHLLLALAALASGPLALVWLRRREGLAPALDGFVFVAIPGLVFFQFVPPAVEHGEYAVLAALAVGLAIDALLPGLAGPTLGQLTEETPSLFQTVSLVGLAVLFGASLLRRGAHGFVGEIGEGAGMHHAHDLT